MDTPANAGTEKDAMNSLLKPSVLRQQVPRIRTTQAVVEKYEQIQDALEHGTITGKVAEQMTQTLKGITGLAKLEMQYFSLIQKFKHSAPVPRSPLLRSVVGLAEEVAPTDGAVVRGIAEG